MPYTYHPREIRDENLRRRLAEEAERNRLSRQQWIDSLGGRAGVGQGAVLAPVELERTKGPLPLPSYKPAAREKMSDAQKALLAHVLTLDKMRVENEYGIAGKKTAAELAEKQTKAEQAFERSLLQTKEGFLKDRLREEFEYKERAAAEEFDYRERAAGKEFERNALTQEQEGINRFEQGQLEAVQEAVEAGTHYYTEGPNGQKQQLAEIDTDIDAIREAKNLTAEERMRALQDAFARKKRIWLNPKRRGPDEGKVSLEGSLRQKIHNFDAYSDLPWIIDDSGNPMIPRGFPSEKSETGGAGGKEEEAAWEQQKEVYELAKKARDDYDKQAAELSKGLRDSFEFDEDGLTSADMEKIDQIVLEQLGPPPPPAERFWEPPPEPPQLLGPDDPGYIDPRLQGVPTRLGPEGVPTKPNPVPAHLQGVPLPSPSDLDSPYSQLPADDPNSPLMDEIRAAGEADEVPLPPQPPPVESGLERQEWPGGEVVTSPSGASPAWRLPQKASGYLSKLGNVLTGKDSDDKEVQNWLAEEPPPEADAEPISVRLSRQTLFELGEKENLTPEEERQLIQAGRIVRQYLGGRR